MSEGEALRRQAEIDELRVWYLEGRLGHAPRETAHECSIEDCKNTAVAAVWLEDEEDADEVHLCQAHFDEVTREA